MPARDGTGPLGTGPIGWRLGPCGAGEPRRRPVLPFWGTGLRRNVRPEPGAWPETWETTGVRRWMPLILAAAGGLFALRLLNRAAGGGKTAKDDDLIQEGVR